MTKTQVRCRASTGTHGDIALLVRCIYKFEGARGVEASTWDIGTLLLIERYLVEGKQTAKGQRD